MLFLAWFPKETRRMRPCCLSVCLLIIASITTHYWPVSAKLDSGIKVCRMWSSCQFPKSGWPMERLQRELSSCLVSGAGRHLGTAGTHTSHSTDHPNAKIVQGYGEGMGHQEPSGAGCCLLGFPLWSFSSTFISAHRKKPSCHYTTLAGRDFSSYCVLPLTLRYTFWHCHNYRLHCAKAQMKCSGFPPFLCLPPSPTSVNPFVLRHVVRKTFVRKQLSTMTPLSGVIVPLSEKIINLTPSPTLLLVFN